MIKGIGIDLIELERIEKGMGRNGRLAERILTENEQKLFHTLGSDQRKVEYLASRFAAKEAFAKAAGCGIGKLSFQHIETKKDALGAPGIIAKGYENTNVFLSITHSNTYAAAQVVIEDK